MIKLKEKIIYAATSLTLSALCLFPGIAQAQIKISPLTIETKAERGQATGVIEITNTSNKTFRARVYPAPFTYNENGFEELESSPQDLTPFLTFSPRELVIEPGQTRRIRLASRFLPSTETGEYRAVIYTEDLEAIPVQTGNVTMGIKPRLGVTVFVRNGDVAANLVVESASYDPETNQIILQVENSGNATALPKIPWSLTNSGGEVASGNNQPVTVIAGGKRNISIEYSGENPIPPGEYQLTGELVWGDAKNPNQLPFDLNLTIPGQ